MADIYFDSSEAKKAKVDSSFQGSLGCSGGFGGSNKEPFHGDPRRGKDHKKGAEVALVALSAKEEKVVSFDRKQHPLSPPKLYASGADWRAYQKVSQIVARNHTGQMDFRHCEQGAFPPIAVYFKLPRGKGDQTPEQISTRCFIK